jgi:hypothetical protein
MSRDLRRQDRAGPPAAGARPGASSGASRNSNTRPADARPARLAADVAALPVADGRTPEDLIGYDDAGLPG